MVAAALLPLQKAGLKILPYLDWLICAESCKQVVQDTSHIQCLGFKVNLEKSNCEPRQKTFFLGLCLNSVSVRASLTSQSLQAALHIFQLGRRLELVQFQRLLGLIAAAIVVVPLGLLKACALQQWLSAFYLHPRKDRHVKLRVTQPCQRALGPWQDYRLPSRRSLVSTDASRMGWGAVWEGRTA